MKQPVNTRYDAIRPDHRIISSLITAGSSAALLPQLHNLDRIENKERLPWDNSVKVSGLFICQLVYETNF